MTAPAPKPVPKPAQMWSARRQMRLGVLTLVVLIGGFGTWAATSQITGAIIATGRIEVDQNRQVIQHPDGGVVAEIAVREGDSVAQGDLLIRLDDEFLRSELTVTEGQLFEIVARRGRYEAEQIGAPTITFDPLLTEVGGDAAARLMEGQSGLYEARQAAEAAEIEQLARRRAQIANQIDGIRAQQGALTTQLTLIAEELTNQQSLLDRGLAQAPRVLALQREEAALTGQAGELAATVAQAEGRMTEIDIEVLRIATTRVEEALTRLRDLQYNELELREKRRSLLTQLDRLEIRAPLSGVVYGLRVFSPRSVVRPADPVLFLVPQDRPLIITTQVEPRDIDQIFVGQEVTLHFSAFDRRTTPELFGRVVQISADAFQDETTSVSYYRAEIELSEEEKDRMPDGITLIPGMPVEAFISTDQRTPLEYLVKPLSDYFAKAFRES